MNHQRDFVELGRGRCGSVWARPIPDDENTGNNDYTVIKRGDGSKHRSVTKEHDIHKHIAHAAATTASASKTNLITGYQVNIVTPVEYIPSDSSKWDSLLAHLPPNLNYKRCIALKNERIPPMQRPVRHLLAQACYGTGAGDGTQDPRLAACLLDAETNEQNCLVRPFLGRRRYQPQQDASACPERPRLIFVTLRNIPLHLDQMEELGLPVEQYAMAMADMMAFLHWHAEVDAGDVEFVLARPRHHSTAAAASSLSIGSKAFTSEGPLGSHAMWLVDFDCCERMATPTDGSTNATEFLTTAARAFWRNDPYYPRPPANHSPDSDLADGKLWERFKNRYSQTSVEILERKGQDQRVKMLPGKVMEMIENTRGRWSKSVV
ncbi:zinc finger protein-domain-containing protein [Copromyces sp. CBS 386.78]|nr:zinc finger protein-domain-containing protein [Copromyces sp. CBS 386.78]